VNGNVTVGTIANNAVNELAFDQTAGSFNPMGIIDQGIAQNTAAANIKIRSAAPSTRTRSSGRSCHLDRYRARSGRSILSYNNSNNTAQVDPWTTTPNANTPYKIFSVTGNVTVEAIIANAITAASINANAITGAKVGNDVDIRNANGNVGSVTNNIGEAWLAASDRSQAMSTCSRSQQRDHGGFDNANAITGAKVANDVDVRNVTGNVSGTVGSVTGAVGSVTGAVGSVTGNVSGSVVGSTGSVVNNVTVQAIANNAITAVSINANAITGRRYSTTWTFEASQATWGM